MTEAEAIRVARAATELLDAVERGEAHPTCEELWALSGLLLQAGRLPLAIKVHKLARAQERALRGWT